jgi:hypothetical protein
MSTTATDQWRVYAVGDCDWWMGRNADEVRDAVIGYYGDTEDEPIEMTAEEMQQKRYVLDYGEIACECGEKLDELSASWRNEGAMTWGHYHGYPIGHVTVRGVISFAEELERRIKAGPKVELFASTEF